ncbi:hypothetical protein TSUD_356500 [Trifolium subterraneum]|uniref:Uncharacterized protein n=1 Tax=Trifolium subterraneum TaxID=3900 RepID=A0A2Z6M4N6_TRISU|nr:hypothetical protein TSUD_356500 [Trifolium subterraneum]
MAAAPPRAVKTPEPPLRRQNCMENHHTKPTNAATIMNREPPATRYCNLAEHHISTRTKPHHRKWKINRRNTAISSF